MPRLVVAVRSAPAGSGGQDDVVPLGVSQREWARAADGGRHDFRSGQRAAALIVYLDTSALVKLVFDEPGSALAAELWDRAESIVSSQLLYPEARAAVAVARRGSRIDPSMLRRSVARIDVLWAHVSVIVLDPDLARTAGDLAEAHGLRGYDAVHLATALRVDSRSLVFATWDRNLARSAVAAGCSVSPPPTGW